MGNKIMEDGKFDRKNLSKYLCSISDDLDSGNTIKINKLVGIQTLPYFVGDSQMGNMTEKKPTGEVVTVVMSFPLERDDLLELYDEFVKRVGMALGH